MYFLLLLLLIVIIYLVFRKKKENFEFETPEIPTIKIYNHKDYTEEEKDKLMIKFGKDIYNIYKRLKHETMKNDLWSYCFIYINGGVYIDTSTFVGDISIFKEDGLIVVTNEKNNLFCNTIYASSTPNNPVLRNIINLSINRILENEIIKEEIRDYITGEQCFTDGILQYLSENNKKIYEILIDYVKYKNNIITVLDPEIVNKNIKIEIVKEKNPSFTRINNINLSN
jgi:mannosyltransferase OCH1-like enzyme